MEPRVIQVAQIWDLEHNPVNGRIYSPDGIAPTLMTPTGGYFEPKILFIMEEKEIIPYNTPEDGVAPTITTMYARLGTNNLTPGEYGGAMGIMEVKSCASRKRGDGHKIETRTDEVANCVTSIDTDSMVAEPQVLTPLRTEEGRQLRKQGIEKFSNRALYPREDGVSNTITTVLHDNLLCEPRKGKVKIGGKYGRLTALRPTEKKQGTNTIWECKCDCGKTCYVSTGRIGITTWSCGCLKIESHRTHNESNTRLYNIWTLMKRRCNNPEACNYGGRGIKVCDEWQTYEPFRDWAKANGYQENLTIDRINNDGNYEPSNCRWVDYTEQSRNRTVWGEISYEGIVPDSTGYRAQITIDGKKIYIAHSVNDIGYLVEQRNKFIRENNLSHKIQEYKHDYDYLLNKDNLLQEPKRKYRIRKLTEREVFRLMGLEDEDIDKIQAADISKTAQYKLAGNSIVVDVLYYIFKSLFIDTEDKSIQPSLF